jgi:hypothetical protein
LSNTTRTETNSYDDDNGDELQIFEEEQTDEEVDNVESDGRGPAKFPREQPVLIRQRGGANFHNALLILRN